LNLIKDFLKNKSFSFWILFSFIITFFISFPILSLIINVFLNFNSEWNLVLHLEIWDYLFNSLSIIFFQSILVIFFGVSTAWFVTIYDFPYKNIINLLLLLPLSIPPYIAAIAYGEIFDYSIYSRFSLLKDLFSLDNVDLPNIRSLPGVIFIFSITLYPYVYIISRAAFSEISNSYNEVGKTLGKSSFNIFFKIFLPLTSFPIVGGVILSILESLNDFGTVQYYGVDTFTTGIYKTWVGLGDINLASQISIFFLFFIFLIIFLHKKIFSKEKININTSKSQNNVALPCSKLKKILLISFCFIPIILGFFIPLSFLLINSFQALEIFLWKKTISNTLNTIFLALLVSFIILILSLIISYSSRIHNTNLNSFFKRISMLGYAIPGSIIGIGILIPFTFIDGLIINFFNSNFDINLNNLFTGSIMVLCFAYIVRFFAISQTTIESGLYRISRNVDDAAKILGKKPFFTLFKIHIPIMSTTVILSLILIFIEIIKELSATLILRPFNFDTLAIQVYEFASEEKIIESSIPSLIIVVLCVIGIIFISKLNDQIFRSEK
tara:strand:+ start:2915 stop:4573 length:1659 start_codon:yes stop_codon:yes gene_type:complete